MPHLSGLVGAKVTVTLETPTGATHRHGNILARALRENNMEAGDAL